MRIARKNLLAWGFILPGLLVNPSGNGGRPQTPDRILQRLREMVPDAAAVAKEIRFLTQEQKVRVRRLSGVEPDTRMFLVYVLKDGAGRAVAYAFPDTHVLRTYAETALFLIRPGGQLDGVEILGFAEPPDYRPPPRWLKLFRGRKLDDNLRLGGEIPNLTGATITAGVILRRARLILAVWRVLYGGDS